MSRLTAHRTLAPITIKDQLLNMFRHDIDRGQYAHGEKLPSRRDVAKSMNIAIGTVTKVFNILNAEGYVRSVNGDGTYAVGPEHRQKAPVG
ncbi:GntR family transcriptional regulator [Streptomyces cellulosae]|uniref:GntR family transcriptional regulator n=1 Tax=Streptomyces cellulosae TaxID=1968 RepID=A0ABW6JDK6_STRCE